MSEIKIINRGRGKVLFADGHQYYKHVLYKNGSSNWRCKKFKESKCAGSVTLSTDQKDILKIKQHCIECAPDITQNIIEEIINEHCEEAIKGREPAPRIFKRALVKITEQGLDLAAKVPVPSFKEKKVDCPLKVEVPNQFMDFLLADYSDETGMRILIFCSEEAKEQLKVLKHYFMDGTYKACLRCFKQIYGIHGDIGSDTNNSNIVPLVFAFMTHQTEKAYSILFNLIMSQVPEWRPRTVTIDFEQAVIKVLSKMEVQVKGCHYHFSNALLKKANDLKLLKERDNKRIVFLSMNLQFLP